MLKEIRNQPPHIRAIFMWLSVFIIFSLIVFVWIQSFQQRLAFLLNPSEKENTEQESPLVSIGGSFNDLRAMVLDLFGLANGSKDEIKIRNNLEEEKIERKIEPRILPLSEDKLK